MFFGGSFVLFARRIVALWCWRMTTLLIATRNAHKVEEIRVILGQEFSFLALTDFPDAPECIEDADTFAGNATKKAVDLAKWLAKGRLQRIRKESAAPCFVLADDSGLEVDALNGAPGVHSARFASLDTGSPGNSSATENNGKLLRVLGTFPFEKRTARFRCVLALTPVFANTSDAARLTEDEFESRTVLFEGACEGTIGFKAQGQGGFGYDPLFFPTGFKNTFGELGEEIKNRLSHRATALQRLKEYLQDGSTRK
jgi:XTP/dITP diphosphohydrolase